MKIQSKVIALIASLFVVLAVVEIYVNRHILQPSFTELERDDARTAVRRVNAVRRAVARVWTRSVTADRTAMPSRRAAYRGVASAATTASSSNTTVISTSEYPF